MLQALLTGDTYELCSQQLQESQVPLWAAQGGKACSRPQRNKRTLNCSPRAPHGARECQGGIKIPGGRPRVHSVATTKHFSLFMCCQIVRLTVYPNPIGNHSDNNEVLLVVNHTCVERRAVSVDASHSCVYTTLPTRSVH